MFLVHLLKREDCPEKWRKIEAVLKDGEDPNKTSLEGIAPIHLAAGLGEKSITLFMKYGAQPNIRALDGTTPLHVAASWGCSESVISLLHYGADCTFQDENGNTPYDLAIEGGHNDCADILTRKMHQQVSTVYRDSPCTSPLSITHRLYQYMEKGTPVCLDATSPDTPSVGMKGCCTTYAKHHHHGDTPRNRLTFGLSQDSLHRIQNDPCLHSASPISCTQLRSATSILDNEPARATFHTHHPHCQNVTDHYTNNHHNNHMSCLICSSSLPQNTCSFIAHNSPCSAHCYAPPKSNIHCHHSPSQHQCSPTINAYCHRQQSPTMNGNYYPPELTNTAATCKSFNVHSTSASPLLSHTSTKPNVGRVQPVKPHIRLHSENKDENLSNNFSSSEEKFAKDVFIEGNHSEINHSTVVNEIIPPPSESYNLDNTSEKSSSIPKSQYTFALSSATSPRDKVAAYVLSTIDFMSQCSIDETNKTLATKTESTGLRESSLGESSGSSFNSFATCLEDDVEDIGVWNSKDKEAPKISCDLASLVKEKEKIIAPQIQMKSQNFEELNAKISTSERKALMETKWKAPITPFPVPVTASDILSSDESYLSRMRSPRIYRMKNKSKVNPAITASDDRKVIGNTFAVPQNLLPVQKLTDPYASADDSLFSSVTAKEVVIKDDKSGIVFIEKHTPSVAGSSIGRRSLDSSHSTAATVDSQVTFIYDWRTLPKISELGQIKMPSANFCKNDLKESDHVSNTKSVKSSQDCSSDSPSTVVDCEDICEHQGSDIDIPEHLAKLSCDEISKELRKYGEMPGPIIPTTKQVYLRRLTSLEANPGLLTFTTKCPDYPPELRKALNGDFDDAHMPTIESKMAADFSGPSMMSKQWREGKEKSSFTYLLLDPRVTDNLPLRAKDMTDLELFKTFICAIFYIGKGKRSRPYCHLHEAVRYMKKCDTNAKNPSNKVQQVIDIWKVGLGVVSLHCFQSVIPVEAYTREACMIEAIGMHKLTNIKRGDFYGTASTWSMQLRRQLGVYLLKKSLQIFLAEGERQICLPDMNSGSH